MTSRAHDWEWFLANRGSAARIRKAYGVQGQDEMANLLHVRVRVVTEMESDGAEFPTIHTERRLKYAAWLRCHAEAMENHHG